MFFYDVDPWTLGDMLAHNDSNFLNLVGEKNESVTSLFSKLATNLVEVRRQNLFLFATRN